MEPVFTTLQVKDLLAGKKGAINNAHVRLLWEGYTLTGFHGCGLEDAESIVPRGFSVERSGSNTGGGLARGGGFYVCAIYTNIAADWAQMRSNKGHGKATVLRVYAKYFANMKLGRDYDWGVMDGIRLDQASFEEIKKAGSSGILKAFNETTLDEDHENLELVFRTPAYPRLVAIPSLGSGDQALMTVENTWKAKEAPF